MSNEQYFLSEQDINSFDELFSKELSKEEYANLQSKLEVDEVFKYKLLLYKSLRKEIEQESANSEMLKRRFRQIEAKAKNKNKVIWFSMAIAASLAIIITISVHFLSSDTDTNKACQMAYNAYKNSEPGLPVIMAKTSLRLLDSAMIEYTGKQYDKALLLLNKAAVNDTVTYYKGVCNELLDNNHNAEMLYEQAIKGKSSFIIYKAEFRLSLVYLKENNKKYVDRIEEISKDESSPYQQYAIKIKQLLGKN